MLEFTSVLSVLFPSLLVGASTALCRMDHAAGETVAFRPPPALFSLVWPVLLISLGVALQRAPCKWPIVLLTVGLACWLLVYSPRCGGDRRLACWVLVLDLWLALVFLGLSSRQCDTFGVVVASAFVAWLTFALLMSCFEVQVGGSR